MRRAFLIGLVLAATGLALAGCASDKRASLDPFAGRGSPYYPGKGPVPWGGGREHVGKPYQVAGRWFTPKEQPNYDKQGMASWYGEAFNRRQTSNGEWFDMTRLTAAHATLPLPSYVKVTNLENGREVVVRVNDRGPFVGTRIIDLSKRSAEALDFKRKGKAKVRVQYIGPAPLDDNGKHLLAMNRELERDTPLPKMIAAASRRKGHTAPAEVQVAAVGAKPRKQLYETATFVPPPAQPAPPAATGIETAFYVQVGSFSDIANAARARDRFASVWPVQFIELSKQGVSVYRVRLGPISGQTDAQTALENAYAAGFPDAHLITAGAMQAALQ